MKAGRFDDHIGPIRHFRQAGLRMKTIQVKCDSCGEEFSVPASLAGQMAKCQCGNAIKIPDAPDLAEKITPAQKEPKKSSAPGKWYVSEAGQSVGPFEFQQIKSRVKAGQIKASDKLYHPGAGEWKEAADISDLAPFLSRQVSGFSKESSRSSALSKARRRAGGAASQTKQFQPKKSNAGTFIALAVAGVAGLAILLVVMFGQGEGEETSQRRSKPKASRVTQPGPIEKPDTPRAFVEKWLSLFAKNPNDIRGIEREAFRKKLQKFYRDGRLDIYATDARAQLQEAASRRRTISVSEIPVHIFRAVDGETFCYHSDPGKESSDFTVLTHASAPSETGQREKTQKTFNRNDFERVRCFQVMAAQKALHPAARVLVAERDGELGVLAFGRVAYAGIRAGSLEISYITGRRTESWKESDSWLYPRIAHSSGIVLSQGKDWHQVGELMMMDRNLIPASVLQEKEQTDLSDKSLLVFRLTGKALSEFTHRYGPAQSVKQISPSSVYIQVAGMDRSWERGRYSQLDAHSYGAFALAVHPYSQEVVGFFFEAENASL
ncbi:MAG: DUF4339 domain-containing protein [Planctomycetes bacterium]|nr:DUF4339 domain-containing protein [Planctomycetota bacterium]